MVNENQLKFNEALKSHAEKWNLARADNNPLRVFKSYLHLFK